MSDHDDHQDDRDRITSLADDMTKRTSAPETAHDSPMLQARVRIPDGTDRRQWLKQQSKSRKQKRRSSGDAKRTPSSSSPTASGERCSNHRSPSQDSSQGGDESDTSCSSSVMSGLSIVSTPEHSRRQRQIKELQFSVEHAASEVGSPDRSGRSRVPPSFNAPPPTPSAAAAAAAGRARRTISRTSSSSSSLSMLGSSSWMRWCSVCEAEFTKLRRPHRCRRCLEAVCASCSPARLPVPGMANPELKRTCRLCAGGSRAPQLDDALTRYRPEVEPAAAAGDATAGGSSGSIRRSNSVSGMMGGIINRAPLGVLSDVAGVVKAGLYPGAPGAADGAGGTGGGGSTGDPLGDDVGVTTPGGSLRKRLSAGGAAALGAIGAGISLAGDRSFRRRGSSVGSASDRPSGTEADTDGGSGEPSGGEGGVTTPGGSLRKRLSAGGAAALGAIGAGIGLSGNRSSRKRDDSAGSAGELSAGVDVDNNDGSGDLYSSEVGVTTPGGSLRKRLSAGGAAAWDAIGAGIGLSSDRSSRKMDDSAGSAGEPPAVVEGDVDYGSGDLYSSEVGVTTPGGSIRKRLSMGGAAAWDAIGAGIGMTSDKFSRKRDDSQGSAGELSAGVDYDMDEGSGDLYGSEVGVTTPGGSIRKRLSAGGAAAWGVIGTGIGRWSGKSPGEGGAAAGAADTEHRLADDDLVAGSHRAEEMDELEEVHASAVNKRAVADADGPPVRRTNAELSLAVRIAIGDPTATAAGKERPAEAKADEDGQSVPAQQEVTAAKPPLHSTVAAVEVSDYQAAPSGADEAAPAGNGEEPQLGRKTVVVVEGAEGERGQGKAATVEGTSLEDVIENTADVSGDVLVEASRGGAAGGDGVSNAPESEDGATDPAQPPLATSDALSASRDESLGVAQMPEAAAPVEDGAIAEAPIVDTADAEGDAPADVPPKDAGAIDERVEVPAEAERVEEAEQPAAVTSETIAKAKDDFPEGGGVLDVVAPAEDGAVVENASVAGGISAVNALPEDVAVVDVPVVSSRETGELAHAEPQATSEVAGEVPQVARATEAIAPPKDGAVGAVVEEPLENATDAGGDWPVDAPSESVAGTEDNVEVPAEAERAEGAERPAPAVTPETNERAGDESPERGEALEDDGATETATSAGSDAPVNALLEAAEATKASVAQDRTAPLVSETVAGIADEVPQVAQTPEAAVPTKDRAVVETTAGVGNDASVDFSLRSAEETDDAEQLPVEVELTEEVEQPAPATPEVGSQAADELPEREEVLEGVAPAEDGAVPEAPSDADTSAGDDAPVDAPPGSAVKAEVRSKEGRAGEAEVTAPVTSMSVTEAAEGLPEGGEIPHAVTPVEDDDVIETPTAHDVSAEGDASVNAPSDVVSGVDDAVEAATLIGRTGEAEESAPVSSETVVDNADELSENTADAAGDKRLDPQGAASESGDDTGVQAAEGQIGDAEELVPVAPEAVPSVVDVEGPSDEEEWTEVVAPVEHDAVADAPSDGITAAGEEAPPEIPTAEEEKTIEKGAVLVKAMQNAPDASETVTQVAVDLSEAEEAAEVLMPVDDDAVLGAPVEDTTGAGGDTPVDESPEHTALNDDVVKASMTAGDVTNDEQPGPITSGLPLEAADDSPGVEEAAETATLVEGDVVADEPIGTRFVSPVSEAAAAAAAAAVAAVEEPEAEEIAEEAEQPAPVALDCVSEASEELSEAGAEAKALDPAGSGAESDASVAAPEQTAKEVPVVDERVSQDEETEETGPAASEAVSGASGDSFEDGGQVVPETTAPQEDDAVAEVPIEETVEGDAPVAAPPEVDVAEEDRPGDVGHPAPVSSMPVVEVGDELSGEAETTDVVPPADDGVVADAPTDDDAGAGAETPEDAPPSIAAGNDDVAETPQEMKQASEGEQSDPTSSAISSDAAGGSPKAGGVPDDTVPVEADAVAEATIDDDTGAGGDESVDASSEAAPATEIPVEEEEEQQQAVQLEEEPTFVPAAEIANEVHETLEIVGTATSVEDGNIVEAAIEGDAGTGADVPVDAPPEVETAVEARAVEGEQPAPVASEPIEGVRDDLPEKEGDSPVLTAPVDDDVAADAPSSNNAGVEGETPVDARAGTAADNEDAAEASMAEEPKGEAEQPAPSTAAVGEEVMEESPGVQELAEVVAPVEDDAVAGVPTEHVAGAGVDERVDSPPEAAATTEAPPVVEEQAVHTELPSSVPSEAISKVADEVSETAEVAAVDATVEDDTSNEILVQAGARAEGDAINAPERVDVTAEVEVGEVEQLHSLASAPTVETEEMVSEEGGSPEAVAAVDVDDTVADVPTRETPGAEGEAHVESLTEITTGVVEVAEVPLVEEPTGEAERPVPVTPAAAWEATDESSEVGESAEIVALVEDGAVVDAPADGVNSDGGEAPVDNPSEASATVEVPVAEEHEVQAEQLAPVASGDYVEVTNELAETTETARGSGTEHDDAEDDAIDEEPIEDGASDGEHAPVGLSAETDGMVEEHAEQAEQPVPVASAPPAEIAGDSPEEGAPVEIMVPVCDDAVADEATDDVAGAESDAPVDAPTEAAFPAEVPALEVLPVQAEQPAPVASEASAEVAPEPSEAGDAVEDEPVSKSANDNFAGDQGDASDGALPEKGAVVEEMVTGMSGEAGQPASAAAETEPVAADELPEGNVAATDDAVLDPPQDVTTGVDESAAVKRAAEAEQPALKSRLLAHDARESSEAGGMVEDVAIVENEAIAEEPAGELSEDNADSQAGKPIEASPGIDLVDHREMGVPSTTRVGEAEESSPVATQPLSGGMVESIEHVGEAPSDAPATSAPEIGAEESASTTVGNRREEENVATLPAELAELAAATSGGHAEEITADAPAVAADVSPAAMGGLVTRKVEDSSTPRSDETEVSPALRESSPPAREARSRAASAEMSEVDEASRVDAETTPEEAPESARDVEDAAPVTSPKDPPRVADSAPETGQGGEEVEAMLEDDDVRRAPVEPMQEAAADASISLEGVPATPKEASEEADSAPAIGEDVNPSGEAEAVTTADSSTGSVEELPEVGDARPAPNADNGNETLMTARGEDAAPLELEDDRKQQPCSADADSSSAETEVNVPVRGKAGGEADGGYPGEAGDSATAVLAAGVGGESMETVVSAAASGGSFPSALDSGTPGQSADGDGDTLVSAVEDADAISGKSGAGSTTHEEVAADASAAEMDEEALTSVGVDSPSAVSTEDTQRAEDGVLGQSSAPAAKGQKPAAAGVEDLSEAAVEGVVETAAVKPAPLVAGDVPTAAPPDLDTEASIPLEADDKREETGSVPTGGGSTRGQEAIAATSSESELPYSSVAREHGAEGRAAAAIEETGTEAKEQTPHPPVPRDARGAPSDQPAEADADDERIRASPKVETEASVPTAAAEEGLEQTLGADRQDTDPREAFEACGRELVPSSEDQVMGDAIKWFRFRAMPCDEPNTVAASVAFFLFFFAFVACLRSSDQ